MPCRAGELCHAGQPCCAGEPCRAVPERSAARRGVAGGHLPAAGEIPAAWGKAMGGVPQTPRGGEVLDTPAAPSSAASRRSGPRLSESRTNPRSHLRRRKSGRGRKEPGRTSGTGKNKARQPRRTQTEQKPRISKDLLGSQALVRCYFTRNYAQC